MKILERYYKKIYKYTNKLLKKVFDLDVVNAMKEVHNLKSEIEKEIGKGIEEITKEDLIEKKLSYKYCKYRTMNNILSVISGASFLNSFCDEDLEEVKNEN